MEPQPTDAASAEWKPNYGETHWGAKLNEEAVRRIRKLHAAGLATQAELAREYGVSVLTIRKVVRRISWRHVQ